MSFFGKKTQSAPVDVANASADVAVASTGGKVDELVLALISGANDPDGSVRHSISKSLQDIGRKQPNLVLSSCSDFINKNGKALSREHRVILLNVINQVLELRKAQVSSEVAVGLVVLGIAEMTKDPEIIPDWQGAASAILVSLGTRFPNEILDELLKRFSPGTVPHYFIIKTLGDFIIGNSIDTVPRLKEVFARILPVLGSIKLENMKWVFASAIGHFCDAVIHYVANIDKGANKSLTTTSFSSEVFPAYEIMYNNWLQSKEAKVRLATLQALGSVCAVLQRDQFESQLPKLVPIYIAFYKKEREHLPISQGLSNMLDVCVKDNSRVLLPLLPQVFGILHPLTCVLPDNSSSINIKNYNELLRCWQTIGIVFSDEICTFLLEYLSSKEVKPDRKVGTLALIKHLITHIAAQLEDKKGLLVSGIKPIVQTETMMRVKIELAQVIIAMASHDYLSLEGGETLIEFIVKNSGITDEEIARNNKEKQKDKEKADPNMAATPEELRSLCDNILNLVTTTIPHMQKVLWPFLLETLIPEQFNNALAMVCKCVAHIAKAKRDEEAPDYIIDFDKAVNLPKPQAIIAKLLVMLNAPTRRGQLGLHILNLLYAIGPILHPSICEMWDNAIPKLVTYLENNVGSATWNATVWEDLVLRLLSETLKIANDDEWTNNYGGHLATQLESLYNRDPDMKRVAFKHLGLVLQKSTHKESIKSRLDIMLATVDHNNELERLGCAQGFGYCATAHLDMTLEKLQNPAGKSAAPQKKSGGFFSFMDKKQEGGGDSSNTLILCYGYIAAYAAPALITSRIDISIMNNLKPILEKARSLTTRESLIKTFDLIAKAMHPSHLKKEYIFKHRDDLLRQVLLFIAPPKEKTPEDLDSLHLAALTACSSLINLDPPLAPELEKMLLDRIVVFYADSNSKSVQAITDNINTVMGSLLFSQPTIDCLCRLLQAIEPCVCSKDGSQRERAMKTVEYLLKKFTQLKVKESERREKSFTASGACIAMLIPRCTDPNPTVRGVSITSIQHCLYLDYVIRRTKPGEVPDMDDIAEMNIFNQYRERISTSELNDQFVVMGEISRVFAKAVPPEELLELLLSSLKGLNDSQGSSASGTCVVINSLIKTRGKELLPKVPSLMSGLLKAMEAITNDQALNGTLHAVRSLATHHEILVIDQLLKASIPHSSFVVKSLQAIVKDESLAMAMIDHLFNILNNSQPYEEKPNPKNPKATMLVPNHTTMSATCAIGELMQIEELEDIISEHYALFFSSLLLRIGTASGMSEPGPTEQISSALRQFIQCGKEEALEAAMSSNDNWKRIAGPEYHRAITDAAAAVAKSHTSEMKKIYEFLLPYMKGNFMPQRVVAASVMAEFVNHCKLLSGEDKKFLHQLINSLMASLADPAIKLQAIIGLANIVSADREDANMYASTVLDALLSSIDDPNETIAMEAMNGLSKIFAIVEESRMSPILVNICHRIRPAFDKENEQIRAASFTLFGSLYRFGTGYAGDAFYEQIHNNLPSLVLHMEDDSTLVKNACKGALANLAPLFRSESVTELLAELSPDRMVQYAEFLNDLSLVLIPSFPERINYYVMTCVDYFKSNWNSIKSNAAAFIGFLLGNLTPENSKKINNLNPGLVSRALVNMLKDKSPQVRKTTAQAMSLLHSL